MHEVSVGFDGDGRVLALIDRFAHDTGAYTPRGLVVPLLRRRCSPARTRSPPWR